MIYSKAVTPDGEPVAVEEWLWQHPIGLTPELAGASQWYTTTVPTGAVDEAAITRPCSWALILPGDEVLYQGQRHVVDGDMSLSPDESLSFDWVNWPDYTPTDLTLVCGEPSDLRRRNPAWCWPSFDIPERRKP